MTPPERRQHEHRGARGQFDFVDHDDAASEATRPEVNAPGGDRASAARAAGFGGVPRPTVQIVSDDPTGSTLFAPRPIRARGIRLQALLAVAVVAVLLGIGVGARLASPSPEPLTPSPSTLALEASATASTSAVAPGPIARASEAAPSVPGPSGLAATPPVLPASAVTCGTMPRTDCPAAVQAVLVALASVPDDHPAVASAAASSSLLCSSNLDCPPARLRTSRPVGSVAIRFAGVATPALFNVLESTGARPTMTAFVVRWPGTGALAVIVANDGNSVLAGSAEDRQPE